MSLFVGARVAVLVCGLLLAAAVIRPWLLSFLGTMRREMTAQAAQHRQFNEEMDRRLAELALRESALNRSATASTVHLSSRLAEADLKATRLQQEYDELASDYNRVVTDSLQQSAMLFAPRPGGANPDGSVTPTTPLPRRAREDGGALPSQARGTADPQ